MFAIPLDSNFQKISVKLLITISGRNGRIEKKNSLGRVIFYKPPIFPMIKKKEQRLLVSVLVTRFKVRCGN